jgi:hypothetical protein
MCRAAAIRGCVPTGERVAGAQQISAVAKHSHRCALGIALGILRRCTACGTVGIVSYGISRGRCRRDNRNAEGGKGDRGGAVGHGNYDVRCDALISAHRCSSELSGLAIERRPVRCTQNAESESTTAGVRYRRREAVHTADHDAGRGCPGDGRRDGVVSSVVPWRRARRRCRRVCRTLCDCGESTFGTCKGTDHQDDHCKQLGRSDECCVPTN